MPSRRSTVSRRRTMPPQMRTAPARGLQAPPGIDGAVLVRRALRGEPSPFRLTLLRASPGPFCATACHLLHAVCCLLLAALASLITCRILLVLLCARCVQLLAL